MGDVYDLRMRGNIHEIQTASFAGRPVSTVLKSIVIFLPTYSTFSMLMISDGFQARTGDPDYRQAAIAGVAMLLCLAIFIVVERLVEPRYLLATAVDASIPFMPLSWLIYVLFFPFVVAVAAYAPARRFDAFMQAGALAYLVALLCFWLLPESLPRPDPAVIENAFLRQRLSRLWALDLPANGFPSLHVAITCLACRMLAGHRQALWVVVLGGLICLSTLTTKQHTLIDVLGGGVLAGVCALYVERRHVRELALAGE